MARLLVMRARSVDRWIRRLAVVAALTAGIAALAVAGAGSDSTALAAQVEIKDPLPVALGLLVPTLSPTIHNAAHEAVTSVPVDAPVHGRARVTGSGATPTGTVAYAWYDNATCSGGLLAGSTEPLVSGVAHETSTFRPRIAVAHSLRVSSTHT